MATVPTHEQSFTMTGKTHYDIVNDNMDLLKHIRIALLSPNTGEDIDGDCSAINFSDWRRF